MLEENIAENKTNKNINGSWLFKFRYRQKRAVTA